MPELTEIRSSASPNHQIAGQQLIGPKHLFWAILGLLCIGFGVAAAVTDSLIVLGVVGATVMSAVLFAVPYLGALIYLVFEYARLSMMFPFLQSLQVGKLIVIPTVLAWFVNWAVFKKAELVRDKVYYLMGLWLMLALVSAPFALNSPRAFDATFDLVKWFIVTFLLMNLLNNVNRWKIALWLLVLLNLKLSQHQIRGFAAGLGAASNQAFYIHDGVGAGSSFFGNATDFGLAMAIVLPLAFYLIKNSKSIILKVAALGSTAAFTISVLYSGSRGAAVAMFCAAIVYWLHSRRKVLTAVLVVGFIAAFWIGAPPEWKERFESAENFEEDATAQQRIDLWRAGFEMMVDHPLTGVGMNNFDINFQNGYMPADYSGAFVAHNILVEAGTELGLGGIGVVLAIFLATFVRNYQTRKLCKQSIPHATEIANFAYALDLALVTYFVGGMFLTVLYYPHLFVLMGFTFALHNIAQRQASLPVEPSTR